MIYLAGPFFTKEERQILQPIAEIIKEFDDTAFIPMEHFIENAEELSNIEWSRNVFDMDIEHLKQANLVVAVVKDQYDDTGTAFELGYAHGKEIPYILLTNSKKCQSILPIIAADHVIDMNEPNYIGKLVNLLGSIIDRIPYDYDSNLDNFTCK